MLEYLLSHNLPCQTGKAWKVQAESKSSQGEVDVGTFHKLKWESRLQLDKHARLKVHICQGKVERRERSRKWKDQLNSSLAKVGNNRLQTMSRNPDLSNSGSSTQVQPCDLDPWERRGSQG